MLRVMVVEDDAQMRDFFAASVSRCEELVLVASVGTVAEAKDWLDGNVVDVLLTDLGLPDGSGLEVIQHAVACNPSCEPLVISMFGDVNNVVAGIEAGALGFIHKDCAPENITQTILKMRAGVSPISPMIARCLMAKYQSARASSPATAVAAPAVGRANNVVKDLDAQVQRVPLSPREHDVLARIAQGFSYAEIAQLNDLSVHSVQSHIKNLYRKLSGRSKSEAVFEAKRRGLLATYRLH
jgi:DNA-binding NarL/FixJ family response regulator